MTPLLPQSALAMPRSRRSLRALPIPSGWWRWPAPGALLAGGVGLLLGLPALPVRAEPLIAAAGVLTRFVLTDNLYLTGQDPQSDMTIQILPNITSARSGHRGSWRFYYGPSALIYTGHSELNRVFHVLQADANFQIIDEYLGIRVTANANQNLIDPGTYNAGFTALGNPQAFGQTASIQVAPVVRLPLLRSDFATVEIAPGINYVLAARTASEGNNSGSSGSQSSLKIASGDYFSRMSWTITANSNLVNSYSGTSSGYSSGTGTNGVAGTVTYPFTDQWNIQGLVGYDWGNIPGDPVSQSQSQPDGVRWRLTPTWSPGRNTVVSLGYGYRYGGPDYYANIKFARGKAVLQASYETSVSNSRSSILNSNVVSFQDLYGQPITQPLANQTLSGSVSNPALRSGYFIQDQLLLSASLKVGRTTATLTVNDYRWDYVDSGEVAEQRQGSLVLSRDLSRRTSGSLGLQYWIYNQSTASGGDFNQAMLWTEFSFQASRRMNGSVRYNYSQQNSSTPGRAYDANALWLTLSWTM